MVVHNTASVYFIDAILKFRKVTPSPGSVLAPFKWRPYRPLPWRPLPGRWRCTARYTCSFISSIIIYTCIYVVVVAAADDVLFSWWQRGGNRCAGVSGAWLTVLRQCLSRALVMSAGYLLCVHSLLLHWGGRKEGFSLLTQDTPACNFFLSRPLLALTGRTSLL